MHHIGNLLACSGIGPIGAVIAVVTDPFLRRCCGPRGRGLPEQRCDIAKTVDGFANYASLCSSSHTGGGPLSAAAHCISIRPLGARVRFLMA
jgi:hypothetical protein